MNTRQIEYILEIARQKNMQRAAEKLYVSQSTLSQTLIKLEKELGCQLFIRGAREMALTREGEAYVQGGQRILDIKRQTYEAIQRLSHQTQRRYRIGISSHEGMDRFLTASGELQKAWDQLDIYAIEDNFNNLMEKLRQKQINLAITTWHSLSELDLSYRVLRQEEIKLVVPEQWTPAGSSVCPARLRWEQLNAERLILPNPGSTIRTMVDNMLAKTHTRPVISREISNVATTLHMVKRGNGLAFLPQRLVEQETGICPLSMTPPLIRYLFVAYNDTVLQDEIMQHFIRLLSGCAGGR